ncbi:zf-HC2 domain-containing protein [Thiomonas sp.]
MKLATLRSCREISALVLAREDRVLSFPERLAIRLHFLMCEACPRFEKQVLTMRQAMNNWRHYRGDDSDEPK